MTSSSEAEGSEYKYNEWIKLALTGIFHKVKKEHIIKFIICINLSDSNAMECGWMISKSILEYEKSRIST